MSPVERLPQNPQHADHPADQPAGIVIDVLGNTQPRPHNPEAPLLYADDLAAIRGDGIFETMMVRSGEVENLERHTQRFVNSAGMLDLPAPDLNIWREATDQAVSLWVEQWGDPQAIPEAALRWAYSRGRESTGQPTGWITLNPLAQSVLDARSAGVKAMTAHRGYSIDINEQSPWALVGAKTLSYAANMAALRYAKEQGLQDIIFLSAENHVLEGPTSSVVMVTGHTMVTPPVAGILPGTTQAALFAYVQDHGWDTEVRTIDAEELYTADSLWLVSSVRYAARVTELDGKAIDTGDGTDLDLVDMVKSALKKAPSQNNQPGASSKN